MTWTLGPYDIGKKIGQGGMASVFLGRHRVRGTHVAVKVMAGALSTRHHHREAFWREAQSVARLAHPNITHVYDMGTIPDDVVGPSGLSPETPYIVMELAAGGRLDDPREISWPEVRRTLAQILDALAHAHARHVIHRDLKPSNVLRATDGSVKISDFGIAHLIDRVDHTVDDRITGTPKYMAPEQILGHVRQQGPWTDLYSLGVIAWRLICGEAPFVGASSDILNGHLAMPLPDFAPAVGVPDGFRDWLGVLLEKRPHDRFTCAADAHYALMNLPDPAQPERTWLGNEADVTTLLALDSEVEAPALSTPRRPKTAAPPIPARWESQTIRSRYEGMGLNALAVREPRFVGRAHERNVLWDQLRAAQSALRMATISGPAGVGKTQLCRWMAQRASELGSARYLEIDSAVGVRAIPHGIAQYLRAMGSTKATLEDILRDQTELDRFDREALAGIVSMSSELPMTLRDRLAAIAQFLADQTQRRPLIVVLDNADASAESLALARYLREQRPELHVLVLVVAPPDRLPMADVHVRVKSLNASEILDLSREFLPVSDELGAVIVERSNGMPDVAIQLIRMWALQGILVEGASGYRLHEGTEILADVDSLWSERVKMFLQEDTTGERRLALMCASTLGMSVNSRELAQMLTRASGKVPGDFAAHLVALGMAEYEGEGWRFASPNLRDVVMRLASEGTWRRLSSYAADILGESERLGTHAAVIPHLIAAARTTEAIDRYLEAAEEAIFGADPGAALAILAERDAAMTRMGLAPSDERRGAGFRLKIKATRGHKRESYKDVAQACLQVAEDFGWEKTRAEVVAQICEAEALDSDLPRLIAQLKDAIRTLERTNSSMLVEAHKTLCTLYVLTGSFPEAKAAIATALHLASEDAKPWRYADCVWEQGDMLRVCGDLDGAKAAFEYSLAFNESIGSRSGTGWSLNALGDLCRSRGELTEARAHLERARVLFASIGVPDVLSADLNLAMVDMCLGNFQSAAAALVADSSLEGQSGFYRALVHLVRATCQTHLGDFEAAAATVGRFEAAFAAQVEPDFGAVARLALACPTAPEHLRARFQAVVDFQEAHCPGL
ncbi:MAG: protein kinase [bacterium]